VPEELNLAATLAKEPRKFPARVYEQSSLSLLTQVLRCKELNDASKLLGRGKRPSWSTDSVLISNEKKNEKFFYPPFSPISLLKE
jgi:hypothetical protein